MLTPELLEPVERVDAVVSGAELGLGLAEELERARAVRHGQPVAAAARPRRPLRRRAADGGGAPRALLGQLGRRRGRRRWPSGATAASSDEPGQPLDATFRLERNAWNGAVEPRLVLRHAQPCAPAPIEVIGERTRTATWRRCWPRSTRRSTRPRPRRPRSRPRGRPRTVRRPPRRTARWRSWPTRWRRRASRCWRCAPMSPRRLPGLRDRVGGFALGRHDALEPTRLARSATRTSSRWIRPPARAATACCAPAPGSPTWPGARLSYALPSRCTSCEYGLRASLVALYRALRHGSGRPVRSSSACSAATARTVARRGLPGGSCACCRGAWSSSASTGICRPWRSRGRAPTALERSPAFRVYPAIRGWTAIPEQRKSSTKRLSRAIGRGDAGAGGRSGNGDRPTATASTVLASDRRASTASPIRRRARGRAAELSPFERRLLGDLFAIVEEHAESRGGAGRSRPGRGGVRLRVRAPRRSAPPVRRGLHHPPGRRGQDLRRHAARHRDAVRGAAARHRRGHQRLAGRGRGGLRRGDRRPGRRRHQARPG